VAPWTAQFGDDGAVCEFDLPRVPASAGGLIGDGAGRLLVLKPTYKRGWTIPGGQMESGGESPWEACRREILEETGLVVTAGRLACVDFLRPRAGKPGGLRFLFDCGSIGPDQGHPIRLPEDEIAEYRWAAPGAADRLLSGPVGRRVAQALATDRPVYLEDGRPVAGMTN
jgi:8-oxo-dGTP diphosphatase